MIRWLAFPLPTSGSVNKRGIFMKTLILSIALLTTLGVQAGLFETIVEAPKRAVEATATVVEDVVTAPADIVKDTASIPAKTVGAIPTEKPVKTAPAVTKEAKEAVVSEEFVLHETEPTSPEVQPIEETVETQVIKDETAPIEPMDMETDVIETKELA
jgi:hypothetical protein